MSHEEIEGGEMCATYCKDERRAFPYQPEIQFGGRFCPLLLLLFLIGSPFLDD